MHVMSDVRYNAIRHVHGTQLSIMIGIMYIEMTIHYYFLGLWPSSSNAGSLTLCHQ